MLCKIHKNVLEITLLLEKISHIQKDLQNLPFPALGPKLQFKGFIGDRISF
jgi:hypothetical protein